MTPAVELRNVCCGGKGAPGSLEGVSLSVAAGECLALCGPAGSGKATLLRLIARRLPPRSGAVCLFARDIWLMSAAEVAGTVLPLSPADPGFDPMTPRQIVAEACRRGMQDPSPAARSAATHAALRQAGLAAAQDRTFGLLPPEDRLRLLAARALLLRPRIVLLSGVAQVPAGLLADLRDAGLTVVAALEEAAGTMADRVVRLDRGRIVADSARVSALHSG